MNHPQYSNEQFTRSQGSLASLDATLWEEEWLRGGIKFVARCNPVTGRVTVTTSITANDVTRRCVINMASRQPPDTHPYSTPLTRTCPRGHVQVVSMSTRTLNLLPPTFNIDFSQSDGT